LLEEEPPEHEAEESPEFEAGEAEEEGEGEVTEADEIPAEGEFGAEGGDEEENKELEAVIRELDAEENPEMEEPTLDGAEDVAPEGEEEPTEEAKDVTPDSGQDPEAGLAGDVGPDSGSTTATDAPVSSGVEGGEEELELDVEALVKEVENDLAGDDKEGEAEEKFESLRKENVRLAKSMKEHREVIQFLRSKLQEINLLNAKLLFSNKLFRANNLSESQKVKVIGTIDRANNIREVKLVYATLAESFKMKGTKLTESAKKTAGKGSASEPVGSTKPSSASVLSEGAQLAERFKHLAGVKKVSRIL
jgi:hypothetical protein